MRKPRIRGEAAQCLCCGTIQHNPYPCCFCEETNLIPYVPPYWHAIVYGGKRS